MTLGMADIFAALACDFPAKARADMRAAGYAIVEPAQPPAQWGFSSDRWRPDSFLAVAGDEVVIVLLHATVYGRGYLSDLLRQLEDNTVRVMEPIGIMPAALRKRGFKRGWGYHDGEHVEVWTRYPARRNAA